MKRLALLLSLLPLPLAAATQADIDRLFAQQEAERAASMQQQTVPTADANMRNSFLVTAEDIEAAVAAALQEKGLSGRIGAMMDGRSAKALYAYHEPLHIEAKGIQLDSAKSRWQANLMLVSEEGRVVSALPAAGTYHEMVQVPMLRRQFRAGEIISESDIEMRDVMASRTRSDTITDASQIIGKSAHHGISAQRPIRDLEIIGAPVVKRDAIIQLRYSAPGMEITTSAQALSAGAIGDVIEVRNTGSRKVVRAVINAPDSASVVSNYQQTALTGVNRAAN